MKFKDTNRLKVKRWKKIFRANSKQKRAGLAIQISDKIDFIYLFFKIFIYLFMAVLGLCFCVRAFSSCGEWGPLFIAVRVPLTIAASLVAAEHKLQMRRLSSCGSRA